MITILNSTASWACDKFKEDIESILDDPSCVTQAEVDFLLHEVAPDLGLNYLSIIDEAGTDFEIQRFKEKFLED